MPPRVGIGWCFVRTINRPGSDKEGKHTVSVFSSRRQSEFSVFSQLRRALGSNIFPESELGDFVWNTTWARIYLPSTNRGTKHGLDASIMPHSRATLTPVRILSPVHMMFRMWAWFSSVMTPLELGLSLFSKTMKPMNSRSDSASRRCSFCTFIQLSFWKCFAAQAITRKPRWV